MSGGWKVQIRLRRAEDAVLADTTGLDLEESFQLLLEIIGSRIGCVKGEG